MSKFLEALAGAPLLADGAMGSYLFERTGRLSEMNHVYEAFNLDRPDLVRQVHFAYLQAGARCLTTNTFGANQTHLFPVKQGQRVAELNRAGVEVAHQAISTYREQTGSEDDYFVLGSVGPTLEVKESSGEVEDIYQEQISSLLAKGVDALLLETFTSLSHVATILELVQTFENPPPLVVHMALHQSRPESTWDQDPRSFVQTAADLGTRVVGVNCCAPWETIAFLDAVADLEVVREQQVLLSLMPNGGDFRRIGHRYLTGVNPEFMGRFARDAADCGVRLIGGCCEVHPPHINEMHNYLHSRRAGRSAAIRDVAPAAALKPVGDQAKKENGPLSRKR